MMKYSCLSIAFSASIKMAGVNEECLGSVDREGSIFELQIRIKHLLGVGAIKPEGSFVGEKAAC